LCYRWGSTPRSGPPVSLLGIETSFSFSGLRAAPVSSSITRSFFLEVGAVGFSLGSFIDTAFSASAPPPSFWPFLFFMAPFGFGGHSTHFPPFQESPLLVQVVVFVSFPFSFLPVLNTGIAPSLPPHSVPLFHFWLYTSESSPSDFPSRLLSLVRFFWFKEFPVARTGQRSFLCPCVHPFVRVCWPVLLSFPSSWLFS